MKKLFLLIIVCSCFGFSQSNNSTILPDLDSISIATAFAVKPIHFNTNRKSISNTAFTSFNSNLNVQINYQKTKGTFSLSSLNQNTNTNLLNRNKIDSFNPSGANTIGSALIIGMLNLLFQ